MKDIVIIGAGGFGKEVAWLIEQINKFSPTWNLLGFVDDNLTVGDIINGFKILGSTEYLKDKSIHVVCSISHPKTRKKIIESLTRTRVKFATLIHPLIEISDTVEIGEGSIICEGVQFTVNIKLGKHVIVYHNDVICHDVVIDNYVSLMPSVNISGNVIIEEATFIGVGTKIIQNLNIGSSVTIGAGSVVIKDVSSEQIIAGVPAKSLK